MKWLRCSLILAENIRMASKGVEERGFRAIEERNQIVGCIGGGVLARVNCRETETQGGSRMGLGEAVELESQLPGPGMG